MPRYHGGMGPVASGAILAAVLLVLVAALILQGGRRGAPGEAASYHLDDAAAFVHDRIAVDTAGRLGVGLVRRVLEWQIHYQQVVVPREGSPRPVIGSGEAMEYVLQRAAEDDVEIDPVDVAEVMAADVEYLLSIGAVGAPVQDDRS